MTQVTDNHLDRSAIEAVFPHLIIIFGEFQHLSSGGLIHLAVLRVVGKGEAVHPRLLVQVQQHFLLELVFAVIDANGVVVSVEAVDECLHRRLL